MFSLFDASLAFPLSLFLFSGLCTMCVRVLGLLAAGLCYDLVTVPVTIFLVIFR